MGQENFFILMEMFMLENGKIIKLMDMENINIKMGPDMKVFGKTTYSMARVSKLGLMVAYIKEFTKRVKNKARGLFLIL